jgi:hypothetical protein
MENNKPNMLKSVMNSGAITGALLIIFALVIYMLGQTNSTSLGVINYVILAFGIFFFTKKYRDEEMGGFISYGQSLGYGVLIGVFAGILLAFFIYIEMKFIDPSLIDKSIELTRETMLQNGRYSEDQVDKMLEVSKQYMTPGLMAFSSVLGFAIIAFIISLITSAIVKKEGNPFQTTNGDSSDNN